MGMTDNSLCNSCTNLGCEFQSGIVRTECAFYMPPYIEPDNCGNYVVMQPPKEGLKDTSKKELAINEEEYISKADYENRLKADMVAMLTEIQLEIEELDFFEDEEPINITQELMDEVKSWEYGKKDCCKVIQQKIGKLKENIDGN